VTTIYELLDAAARPVLDTVPRRVSVDDFYHPDFTDEEVRALGPLSGDPADLVAEVERHMTVAEAFANTPFGDGSELNDLGMKMFSLVLRGSVRAVLTGVFEQKPERVDIRCYGDGESAFAWSERPDGGLDFCGDEFSELPRLILDYLPHAADGVFETIWISADGRGVFREGQDEKTGAVLDFLARERTGTTVVDLVAYGGLCSEYPEQGFVVVDNDLGRHVLTAVTEDESRRDLILVKSGHRSLAAWFQRSVEAGRTGL
jgi:hypothetical protein